ncbi:MAG: AI-2E family transporter [Rhizobiales bacterium]|nr:AI-2E family transporter [Hyphomicrobiales bacterium]MBO6698459.1 AI-2E family transporter [Hyphomicrobiales bacterium]MBO6735287.1 AI-2E family transporter [Hyphomicrobiales bacterium]MBO6910905.1 AI-2E family transporter [Hyphomicrobiales bacterium]MBO6957275.1 AI-2E family transporter [Hyphomicrobiales bacterium]
MTLQRQAIFWALAAAALIAFIYVFSSVLLPFVAGMAIAYLLDPAADWFERRGFSRLWATLSITALAIIIVVIGLLLLVPLLVEQMIGLVEALRPYIPETLRTIFGLADEDFRAINAIMAPASEEDVAARQALFPSAMTFDAILTWLGTLNLDLIREFIEANAGTMAALASRVLDQGAAVVGVLSTLVITPIVAVYMLYDWDNLVARIDALLPRDHADTIRDLAKKIDHVMAGFIRGQFILALILGTFYATALTLVGLNFGLLIGLGAGLLSFIPYIGSLVGFGTSVGVALVQFWSEPWWIVAVAGIFFFGQFVEGNFLQPKIVGDAVGLHPVVLFFAMLAFGSLYGFLGLLIAVPVAASLGVLTRFGVSRYKKSIFYKGTNGNSAVTSTGSDES